MEKTIVAYLGLMTLATLAVCGLLVSKAELRTRPGSFLSISRGLTVATQLMMSQGHGFCVVVDKGAVGFLGGIERRAAPATC